MSPSVALFDADATEPRVDARRLVVIGTQRFAGHALPTAGAVRIGHDPSCEIVIVYSSAMDRCPRPAVAA